MATATNVGPCPNPECGSADEVRRLLDAVAEEKAQGSTAAHPELEAVAESASLPMAQYLGVFLLDLVLLAAWWVLGGWWIIAVGRNASAGPVRLVAVWLVVVAVGVATGYRFIDWVRTKSRRRNRSRELWGSLLRCGACGCLFFGEGGGYCIPKDAADVKRYVDAAAGPD